MNYELSIILFTVVHTLITGSLFSILKNDAKVEKFLNQEKLKKWKTCYKNSKTSLTTLWLTILVIGLYLWSSSTGFDKIKLSIFLILNFALLNTLPLGFFGITLTAVVNVYSWIKELKSKIKLPFKNKTNPLQVKLQSILLLSFIMISFSFNLFLTQNNAVIIGNSIIAVGLISIVTMIIRTLLLQKFLLECANRLESIDSFLKKYPIENLVVGKLGKFVELIIKLLKTVDVAMITKIQKWLEKQLSKISFWSIYGVAIFRALIMTRLLSYFLLISFFLVIVEGNFLYQLANLAGNTTQIRSQWISKSFFLYAGDPIDPSPFSQNLSSFLGWQTLAIGAMGWILFVVLLILVIDLFATSYDRFGTSFDASTQKLKDYTQKLIPILENIEPVRNEEDMASMIADLKAQASKEGTTEEDREKIKNKY